MSKMLIGSICLTDLLNEAKKPHSAFTRGNNGKAYANIVLWENDEPDKYGNTVSIQLNSTKEKRESEGKVYIGNAKPQQSNPTGKPEAISKNETDDDLPF